MQFTFYQKNHTNAFDILVEGMKRECEEELGTANGKFRVLGLINEELTNVGKAHLGIVFSFVLESFLTGTSSELGKICFVEAENLKVLEVELWSRLALTLA